jgi:hypothetical protein
MNDGNLIPFSERSKSEAREMGTRGGVASGKVRRFRKTLRESLKNALGCEIPKDSPLYKRTLSQMKALGIDGEPTVQDIPVLGMIVKSAKDPTAFAIIRDTIGEKPVETFEDVTPQSPIILGQIDIAKVEKAKAEHEARQLESDKK